MSGPVYPVISKTRPWYCWEVNENFKSLTQVGDKGISKTTHGSV